MNVPALIDAKVANSLKGVLIDLIQRDYQFITGDKIPEMFASDVVGLVEKCYRDPWKLDVDQVLCTESRIRVNPAMAGMARTRR